MSKFATKAAANMFCQARYEAAKSNERLSSREGAAEEIGIDRTRLARIELGSTIPYQEEVLLMADCYKAPELKGNYCREMCPLGKNMPKIENAGLDRISLRMLSSFKKINEAKESLLDITADGVISEEEKPELKKIIQTLDEVNEITQNLKNWIERSTALNSRTKPQKALLMKNRHRQLRKSFLDNGWNPRINGGRNARPLWLRKKIETDTLNAPSW